MAKTNRTKAEWIRQVKKEFPEYRQVEIVNYLAQQGVAVSSSQVSTTLAALDTTRGTAKKAGRKPTTPQKRKKSVKRRKKGRRASETTASQSEAKSASQSDQQVLILAAQLIRAAGGIRRARTALTTATKLNRVALELQKAAGGTDLAVEFLKGLEGQ